MSKELVAPERELLALALLTIDGRERGFERLGWGLPITSLAALVEVHRRSRQCDGDSGGFARRRRAPEVVFGELAESELLVGAHFPEEIRIELRGDTLRVGKEHCRRRIREAKQHGRGL